MVVASSGTFVLQGMSTGLAFITALMLARLLGPTGYGAYAYAYAWVGFLLIPALLGMNQILVRGIATYQAQGDWPHLKGLMRWANYSVLIVSCVIALVAAAGGALVLPSSLRLPFCLAMPLVPITALITLRQAAMTGFHRVVSGQLPEFALRPILYVVALSLFAVSVVGGLTPAGAVALNVVSVAIAFGAGVVMLRRALPEEVVRARPSYRAREWRRAALPMTILGGMWIVNPYIATIMLGSIKGAREAGIYTVVAKGAELVTMGMMAVNVPLSPRVARLYAVRDMARVQHVTSMAARASLAWALPVSLGLIVFRHQALGVFGPRFEVGGTALIIMVLGQLVNSAAGPVGNLLMMTKHEHAAAIGVGAGLVINIALNALLVPRYGLVGAAIGTSASRIAWNVLLTLYAAIKMRINATPIGPSLSGVAPLAPETLVQASR